MVKILIIYVVTRSQTVSFKSETSYALIGFPIQILKRLGLVNLVLYAGCPPPQKKRGISECYSVCFTANLIWNLEHSFQLIWKFIFICLFQVQNHFWKKIGRLEIQFYSFIKQNCTVVNQHVILSIFYLDAYIVFKFVKFLIVKT